TKDNQDQKPATTNPASEMAYTDLQQSPIIRHPSPVIRHPSPLTPHPSFFLLPFILQINNSQRRQGYSKGLPPSVKWFFIGGNRLRVLDVASAPCFVITVKDFLPFPR